METRKVSLVGDIGGTNARFALLQPGARAPDSPEVLPGEDHSSLEAALQAYLSNRGLDPTDIDGICLAVASPVDGSDENTELRMTNSPWRFSRRRLKERFGWQKLKVVNDFTAMALGVTRLPEDKLVSVGGGVGEPKRPRLIMGPGTGLGISALVPLGEEWLPLSTEGGHADFAPADETEDAVLQLLRRRFGRVSVERLLCGQGLADLYQALGEIHGTRSPENEGGPGPKAITSAALAQSDPLAVLALRKFCEMLGRAAGNAVLTQGAFGGVFLCGGLLPRFQDFFLRSGFRPAFEDKGRMRELMQRTPVYLVTEPGTGLIGAAEALNNPRA